MRKGIYIHIPFCSYKCPYCDFYSVTDVSFSTQDYTGLIAKEAELRGYTLSRPNTIYFGGGTPSLMDPDHLEGLMIILDRFFDLSCAEEITLEANPETVTTQKLKGYRKLGINRISIGVQSFNPRGLKALGRHHSPDECRSAYLRAREAGFDNINIDLIWGWPGQRDDELLEDLHTAIELRPDHISLYLLTYHQGTPFGDMLREGKCMEIPEESVERMYKIICGVMKEAGYMHYEISNWCLEGKECRHNLLYWEMDPFLGLGAGAWGFVSSARYGNVRNLQRYREMLMSGKVPEYKRLTLSEDDIFEEKIMLGLRTSRGVDEKIIKIPEHLEVFFRHEGGKIAIREEYMILSNELISEVLVYNSLLNNLTEVKDG